MNLKKTEKLHFFAEIVHFVGGGQEIRENRSDILTFGDYRLRSRLIVGTGK